MSQFLRDFEAHLKKLDRLKILELLSKVDEPRGHRTWLAVPCGAGGGPNGECWCRMVVTEKCDLEDDKWPDPECIVPAGSLAQRDAEFLVEMHNAAPSIIALRDMLETRVRCPRCSRPDLRLWMLPEHYAGCNSMTDEEHEAMELRHENEELKRDNLELRKQLEQIDG